MPSPGLRASAARVHGRRHDRALRLLDQSGIAVAARVGGKAGQTYQPF